MRRYNWEKQYNKRFFKRSSQRKLQPVRSTLEFQLFFLPLLISLTVILLFTSEIFLSSLYPALRITTAHISLQSLINPVENTIQTIRKSLPAYKPPTISLSQVHVPTVMIPTIRFRFGEPQMLRNILQALPIVFHALNPVPYLHMLLNFILNTSSVFWQEIVTVTKSFNPQPLGQVILSGTQTLLASTIRFLSSFDLSPAISTLVNVSRSVLQLSLAIQLATIRWINPLPIVFMVNSIVVFYLGSVFHGIVFISEGIRTQVLTWLHVFIGRLVQLAIFLNPTPIFISTGSLLTNITKIIWGGILSFLHVIDPSPVFHFIRNKFFGITETVVSYINPLSPFMKLLLQHIQQSATDLINAFHSFFSDIATASKTVK